jgi:hypothetical protein
MSGYVSKKRNRSDEGCPSICTDGAVAAYLNKMDVWYSPSDRRGFKTHLRDDICFAAADIRQLSVQKGFQSTMNLGQFLLSTGSMHFGEIARTIVQLSRPISRLK